MHAAVRIGERVGLRSRRLCLPIVAAGVFSLWAGFLLCCAGASSAAHAGTLYRCTGSMGEAVFTGSTVGYRTCRRIGLFGNDRSSPRQFKTRPATTSFAAVQSSALTTARAFADLPMPTAGQPGMPGSSGWAAPALFAAVQSSVDTTAQALAPIAQDAAAASGAPGRWEYHDSRSSPLAAIDAAPTLGERVLRGAVYRVVHPDGSVEYTNQPPPNQRGRAVTMLFSYIATCMACDLHSPIRWGSVRLNLLAYADVIRTAAVEFGVDEAFLRAIIHAESAFNPNALSLKGAQGLMQLMPRTAGDMGVLDAFDAQQNIRGGARYLGLLLRTFAGNERLAAAAFNAGPGAVQRYNGVPPYAETQVYVERVGALRGRYGQAIHPPLAARAGTGPAIQ